METGHDKKERYRVQTKKGNDRMIPKNPDIERATKPTIDQMSDIGKLTHLFWGYNIVDTSGLVMRKFKFLTSYPIQAKQIIRAFYPSFYYLREEVQQVFRDSQLNDKINALTGFKLVRSKEFR